MSAGTNIFILLFLVLGIACHPSANWKTSMEGDYLMAAEGGGFAGLEHRYYLDRKGGLYYKPGGRDTFEFLTILNRNLTAQLFKNADHAGLETGPEFEAGNMYRILEYQRPANNLKRVWSMSDTGVPEEWMRLNNTLIQLSRREMKIKDQ